MRIYLDPDLWLCLGRDNFPVVLAPCHWSSAIALLEADNKLPKLMHDIARVTLLRNEVFGMNGTPIAVGIPNCPKCGKMMVLRFASLGSFFGCSHYPACVGSLPVLPYIIEEEAEGEPPVRRTQVTQVQSQSRTKKPNIAERKFGEQAVRTGLVSILDRTVYPAVADTEPRSSRRTRLEKWAAVLRSFDGRTSEDLLAELAKSDPSITKGRDSLLIADAVRAWFAECIANDQR